jgi:energy-coupling factor transporter ATP-binding protein EcfA2
MNTTITVESPILESPRVAQVRGLFDLPASRTDQSYWEVQLPLEGATWQIGLITGPSGCGKSTIARHLWPAEWAACQTLHWPAGHSLLDGFPAGLPIKDITGLLSAVGFSSPPAWLRPFAVLSTGQQFRVTLARLLGEALARPDREQRLLVVDEYTSVVDRTVARIGSAAVAREIRKLSPSGIKFVAVTCHADVEEWLQPDWVYRPAEGEFTRRCQRRRPPIVLDVWRCDASAWRLFAPHHYLSHSLAAGAVCFLAHHDDQPVAFSAWLPWVGAGRPARREHRTVTLPDFQGVGIGQALSGLIASLWRGLGYRALSTTTHPALLAARLRSPWWVLRRAPSLASSTPPGSSTSGRRPRRDKLRHATTRLTAGFEYTGPALPARLARRLLEGDGRWPKCTTN